MLGFDMLSETGGKGLPLVAFKMGSRLSSELDHDEFNIAHELRQRGWVVPAYTMAPHSEKMKLMRVVVREDFSRSRCDALIKDFKLVLDELRKIDAKTQQKHQDKMMRTTMDRWQFKGSNTDHGKDEKHSLQGKHDKSHPIC